MVYIVKESVTIGEGTEVVIDESKPVAFEELIECLATYEQY